MDWVHCNNCYIQPGDEEIKKFFITNCGHIYCDECLHKECRICHTTFTSIPLTSNMSSEVAVYFQDPVVNLKKQIKILEFQHSHRIRMVSHNRDKIRSYKALQKENYNLKEELKLFKSENKNLRDENKRLQDLQIKSKNNYLSTEDHSTTPLRSRITSSQFLSKDVPTTPKNMFYREDSSKNYFTATSKNHSNPNFFFMSDSKCGKNNIIFTTPDLPKFIGDYRTNKISPLDTNTPRTPESLIRELNQRDPLQRKIKLPAAKSGPSPTTRTGFQSLTLSRVTSTPKKDISNVNKYLKYFK